MRLIALPDDLQLPAGAVRSSLGPPRGMTAEDCETAEVVHAYVTLPSGSECPTVSALVVMEPEELAQIEADGRVFVLEFIGSTFPPVMVSTLQQWSPDARSEERPASVG